MLKDFKQFVASKVCLSCDGCCRFHEAASPWRPYVSEQEKIPAPGLKNQEKIFSGNVLDEKNRIRAVPVHGLHHCHFFAAGQNACGIYFQRPFECRLYPFLLMKRDGGLSLCAHLSCPYIQDTWDSEVFDDYTDYLKEFFRRKDVKDFIRQNPGLIVDYASYQTEVELLFTVEMD